ncbi:MAG TPA: helix-hairpin-helix domain-containing protein [Bacteroidales bacterium]|nr:helix-hairpin-helix domain-containing protein [Bacteroidales bacterium]
MKSWSFFIKTYFTFSKGERNGITALFIVLLVIISIIIFLPKRSSHRSPEEFLVLQKEIDSLFIQPDTGRNFIQTKLARANLNPTHQVKQKYAPVDINRGDSIAFERLPGIGPVFASRIIKYRNLLGGFYHINQLQEVYGLKEENLTKAKPYMHVGIELIKGIDLDTSGFKTLARHPYIGRERAWKIINLRKKLSPVFISLDVIQNSGVFDSIQWVRVRPYLVSKKSQEQIK